MFSPNTFSNAFPPPPPGVKIYRRSFLYATPDALADVRADGYFAPVADRMRANDIVTVHSTHATDGGRAVYWAYKTPEGAIYVKPPFVARET